MDKKDEAALSYAVKERLHLIDILLAHYGTINRAAIMDYFTVSTVTVANDFATYMKLAPGNMEYNRTTRTYNRTPDFVRLLP